MNFPDNLFTPTYKLPLFLTNPLSDNIRYLTNRAPDGARHLPIGKGGAIPLLGKEGFGCESFGKLRTVSKIELLAESG